MIDDEDVFGRDVSALVLDLNNSPYAVSRKFEPRSNEDREGSSSLREEKAFFVSFASSR
jgi:hypothetical protein